MTDTAADHQMQGAPSGRNLVWAIVVAVVLAGGFIVSLVTSDTIVAGYIAAIMVLGCIEASAQLRRLGIRPIVLVLVATSLVTTFAALQVDHLGQVLGMLTLLLGSGLWLLVDSERADALRRMAVTILLGLWLPLLGSFAVLIAAMDDGRKLLFLVVAATAFADVGAYAVGSQLGRHKVAPSLSPNKSWEGLIGGLVTAAAVSWALVDWVWPMIATAPQLPTWHAIVVGLVCGLVGFAGDLFESMIKRDLGIKDFGSLLPGHGGILDRFDAILVALPVGWIMLVVL